MLSKIQKLTLYLNEYLLDFSNVIKFNSYSPFEDPQKRLFYKIVINAHAIEKGLSLDNPRPLFGQKKIAELMSLVRGYDPEPYGVFPLEMVAGALRDYLTLHAVIEIDSEFLSQVKEWQNYIHSKSVEHATGGARLILSDNASPDLTHAEFLSSRFSCRAYQPKQISPDLVKDIVKLAQSAPSQCNRQSSRIHCYQDKDQIVNLLTLQGGSSGFVESVPNLFVLTSELTAWGGAGQRNQSYVDGALFSMVLMYACQAFGIATCPLNLAITNKKEKVIQKAANIHGRERVIMMMAFGYPVQRNLKAAASPRLPTNDILTIH
jgi:nitroreductase